MALATEDLTTELSLGLPGGSPSAETGQNGNKWMFSEIDVDDRNSSNIDHNQSQVVGWPPVCSYRRKNHVCETSKFYVKVNMDGTPYMRKIHLKNHKGYSNLFIALEKLFSCLLENHKGNAEYTPIYEDKDGDWLLVGDVPWEQIVYQIMQEVKNLEAGDSIALQVTWRKYLCA